MSKFEDHCDDCMKKFGKSYSGVHHWLDALAKDYSGSLSHRDHRYHREGVEIIRQRWGDEAAHAASDHILRDWPGLAEAELPKNMAEAIIVRNKMLQRYGVIK